MLLKNVSGQGVYLFDVNATASPAAGKTGDAANITGYYCLDNGTPTFFATANPTEVSAAHMPGLYWQPLAQAETNGNMVAYYWTSSTSGCVIAPLLVLTTGVNLPVAAPAASGGLPTVGTGSGQINPTAGGVDVQTWLTHAVTAATSGVPDINVKNYNNQAATTDANNLPVVDVGDWLGHAVTVDSNNAPNVSVKYFGSTAVTGRDIGSSVLLSSGTGTGQLNFTSGVVQANTVQFNGHNVVTDSNNYPGVNIMDVAGQAAAYYTGQAQGPGTGSNQVQLASTETSNPLFRQISLVGGKGTGQVAICTAYNSSTKTATINCPQGTGGNWVINPDSSTLYVIDGLSAVLDSNGNAHVLGAIKQNQQLNHFPFYLVLSSDHMSPATGKTVTATRDIYDGNGFVACANSPTEDGNGWYNLTLAASDLNAPVVALRLTAPGCDPVNFTSGDDPMIKFPINPQTPQSAGSPVMSYATPVAADDRLDGDIDADLSLRLGRPAAGRLTDDRHDRPAGVS